MDELQILREKNIALDKELNTLRGELHQLRRALEIEAALEKVRARTINMRNSAELSDASALLFQQLKSLGIEAIRSGVGIFDAPHEAMEVWLTTVSDSQEVLKIQDYFSLHVHPVFEIILPARQEKQQYAVKVLKGHEVRQYYQTMSTYLSLPQHQVYHEEEYFYFFFFSQGSLNVVTNRALTEEERKIMVQLASAFGLIYTRFNDLLNAELQTREALRRTSLDRVRAEIASMRTAKDLQHITPLIWRELQALEVPFFRCGVFIISEKDQLLHAYLSTPEGKSLGVLHLPFDGDDTTRNIVANWRLNTVYRDHWDQRQFQSWVNTMLERRQINTVSEYQGGESPLTSLYLHGIPFSQGMLYVGSGELLHDDHIDLVQSLANAFSVAYARYEDFIQLEEAKNKIEATLTELRETQSQLIQREKMASLGEMTAGIAHEIQNPLNFVNNFAEVNAELLAEMQQEIDKHNFEEVKTLANTVAENEKKITIHGKRADAIVKSMLQHSRGSTGQKELTDLNALADEYLRLAYHGLRAKDKTFNAEFHTDRDPALPKISVVPQDIGRVLLNLINNAFYAVSAKASAKTDASSEMANGERRMANGGDQSSVDSPRFSASSQKPEASSQYKPMVTVTTKNLGDKIEIRVKDNGNGIPEEMRDKIFQPFFTTKPTGQGTGLGLSLSYDIVKAHGGTLSVETKEGDGAEFIIHLPIT